MLNCEKGNTETSENNIKTSEEEKMTKKTRARFECT
jgi:hypothetical protein